MRFVLMVSLCVVFVAGCAVGPDYKRPAVETPAKWRLEEPNAKDLANTAWWGQFNDPVLSDLIGEALRQNRDLAIATARIDEFMGRYNVARADLFPQVGSGTSVIRKGLTKRAIPDTPDSAAMPYSDYQTVLNGSWELDLWGRIRRTTEAARADLLGMEEARRGVVMTLVSSVAGAYTDLRHLDRQLDIAKRTAGTREESFKLFTLRFERGLISELELRQIESEYRSALATIPGLEKQIVQQENALSVLLGRNPGIIARGVSLENMDLPAVPAGLPSELIGKRPDIRQAEDELIAANARIGAAKALYFPTISLTGMYGVESAELSLLFSGPSRAWNYGASATLPIFNAGKIAGQVKTSEAVQQQALFRYQKAIQNGFREVEDALIDQNKSREQSAIQKQQVDALKSYAKLARIRYENGYTSYLEVLDASRSLFTAELLYAQTQGNLFRALVNLYKAMGGGWDVEAEKQIKNR